MVQKKRIKLCFGVDSLDYSYFAYYVNHSLKQSEIRKKWYLIDASGLILGRLAVKLLQY